jgi:hypothetical protein
MAPPIVEIDEAKPGVDKVATARATPHVRPYPSAVSGAVSALLSLPTAFQKDRPRGPKVRQKSLQKMICATTVRRCTLIKLSPCAATTRAGRLEPNERAMIDADPSVRVEPIATIRACRMVM